MDGNDDKNMQPQAENTPLMEAIKEQAREDESPHAAQQTLRKIIGGDFLTGSVIRSQIGVILLIVGITIIYVSNRYICQKNMLEIDKLKIELQDAKFRSLSSASQLTEQCRETNVLEMLKHTKDSTLKIAGQPPYIINIPE